MSWLLDAAIARDLARDSGLSHPDYYVLVSLSETPGQRMRMSDLATGILWSKSRLSHWRCCSKPSEVSKCSSGSLGTFAPSQSRASA